MRIAAYTIEHRIAAGGMGTVYAARAPDGSRMAIKRLHPHLVSREQEVEAFLDEARVASRIVHPNVCPVVDAGIHDGAPYLVMPLLHGATLSALVRAATESSDGGAAALPPTLAAHLAAEACRGLHAAHELRNEHGALLDVVHRDVTARNVLVGYDGGVRVLDFGIARFADQEHRTRTGVIKGTLYYMAPEQLQRTGVDRRSDVWSIGVVLWEMLAQRSLFRRKTDLDAVVAIARGPIPAPSQIAPHVADVLDAVVLRALERDPARRWPTAAAMADALDAFVDAFDGPPAARSIGAWARGLVPPGTVSPPARSSSLVSTGATGDTTSESAVTEPDRETDDRPELIDELLPAWQLEPARRARAVERVATASADDLGALADERAATRTVVLEPEDEAHGALAVATATRIAAVRAEPEAARGRRVRTTLLVAGGVTVAAVAFASGAYLATPARLEPTPTDARARPRAEVEPAAAAFGDGAREPSSAVPDDDDPPAASAPSPEPTAAPTGDAPTSRVGTATEDAHDASAPDRPVSPTARASVGAGFGTLNIPPSRPPAGLYIDGRWASYTPLWRRLPAGRHTVTFVRTGAPRTSRVVRIRAGATVTLHVP